LPLSQRHLGIPIQLTYHSPQPMLMQGILKEIRLGIFAGSNPIKPYRSTDGNCKQDTKVLSWNQIVLGVCGSPRCIYLLEWKWDRQQWLNVAANLALDQAERVMKQIFGRKLPVAELRHTATWLNRESSLMSDPT
jgi:hypothetical protein